MDKLIKVEARKEFSNGKYVLRERCDLQFAGESRAKYVSESAVSVAGRRRRRREENSSHMTPTHSIKQQIKSMHRPPTPRRDCSVGCLDVWTRLPAHREGSNTNEHPAGAGEQGSAVWLERHWAFYLPAGLDS